jgi:hypothetical protein
MAFCHALNPIALDRGLRYGRRHSFEAPGPHIAELLRHPFLFLSIMPCTTHSLLFFLRSQVYIRPFTLESASMFPAVARLLPAYRAIVVFSARITQMCAKTRTTHTQTQQDANGNNAGHLSHSQNLSNMQRHAGNVSVLCTYTSCYHCAVAPSMHVLPRILLSLVCTLNVLMYAPRGCRLQRIVTQREKALGWTYCS